MRFDRASDSVCRVARHAIRGLPKAIEAKYVSAISRSKATVHVRSTGEYLFSAQPSSYFES